MATTASSFIASTIGRKIVMAATGVILFGFVVAHMAGNLQLYQGPSAINGYAVFLREFLHGAGLWIARGVLLVAVVLHVWAAVSLTRLDLAARPVAYREWKAMGSTYASRTMRWTGAFVALFVVYHLLDLTLGRANPGFDPHDPYRNVLASFQRPAVVAFYVLAVLGLSIHLRHGVWSMLQSVGASHPRYDRWRKAGAAAFAVVVGAGFVLVPLAVAAGWVR